MDGSHPRQRNRLSGGLSPGEARQGLSPGSFSPATNVPMTRAERFEDEKRRIIESCFSKKDANGAATESYITHIRVTEDAAYPQTPPPPESPPANKKPRVVIVAVRNTGRVRMHKGRENSNGSFSVGKTWNLDDFSAVESYVHSDPQTREERQWKQWAGDHGFTVTLTKPYYWQAGTSKEKEFFIASLVKIYRKYTQGKVPQLIGFSQAETDAMLGGPSSQPRNASSAPSNRSPLPSPAFPPPQSRQGVLSNSPSRERGGRPSPDPSPLTPRGLPSTPREPLSASREERPTHQRSRTPSAHTPNSASSYNQPSWEQRQPRSHPSQDREMRRPPSRDPVPSIPSQATFGSGQRITPSSSRPDLGQSSSSTLDASVDSSVAPSIPPPQSPRRKGIVVNQPKAAASTEGLPTQSAIDGAYGGLPNTVYDRAKPNGATAAIKRDASPSSLRPPTAQSTGSSRQDESADDRPRRLSPKRKPVSSEFKPGDLPRTYGNASTEDVSTNSQAPENGSRPSTRESHTAKESPFDRAPKDVAALRTAPPLSRSAKSAESVPVAREQPRSVPPSSATTARPRGDSFRSTPDTETTVPERPLDPAIQSPATDEEVIHRPGLGPMIKKKSGVDIANQFRKAAKAANAFRPRAGGGAEKFLAQMKQQDSGSEPDGITGVVPAPGLLRAISNDNAKSPALEESVAETPRQPSLDTSLQAAHLPHVTVSSPPSAVGSLGETPVDAVRAPDVVRDEPQPPPPPRKNSPEPAPPKAPEVQEAKQRRRRSNKHAKYLAALGVDPAVLEGRGLEFESTLSDFGWSDTFRHPKKIDTLESDIRRELGRVEAGSWLGHLEQKDERVEWVEKMLDRAIAECDELEGLLTLYGVELSSLNEDIAFIEAQSQGLQVQTANQKLLQTELSNLVETISITPKQLAPLRQGSIGKPDGLEAIERALLLLYRAMITIDPGIRSGNNDTKVKLDGANINGYGNTELSSMRALKEKKDHYLLETGEFLERLRQFMDMTFGAAALSSKDALSHRGPAIASTKLDASVHDAARASLWQFSPLLLFAKEIDMISWESLIKLYQTRFRSVYQEEFRNNAAAWKRLARKPTGEEADLLFTSQEKEAEGLSTTARKLTVKRSQTIARTLRTGNSEKPAAEKAQQQGRLHPFEVFAGGLEEMSPLIFAEQNFIVDFFHATSGGNMDFAEAVDAGPPASRRGTNLYARKLFEADRAMARKVVDVMEEMFGFWAGDMQNLVEWSVKADPLQGVGILATISRTLATLEETNQDFLTRSLQKLHERLAGLFARFVDDQIRAIEDTKVKTKKRKGVIAFIKIFPNFSAAVENMIPLATAEDPEAITSPLSPGAGLLAEQFDVRRMVDDAYGRINKAMFESLKVIAKESPAVTGAPGQGSSAAAQAGDPEDKEALNYHILLIENMNHYVEEVDGRACAVLSSWREEASREMDEHLGLYVDTVIRRPLGKLLDFVESTETLLPTASPPTSLTTRPSHSRSTVKKLLAAHDSKELRRGADALRKRVDKHFGDADDPGLSRGLVAKVLRACEMRYVRVRERLDDIVRVVYAAEPVEVEWGVQEIAAAFRR